MTLPIPRGVAVDDDGLANLVKAATAAEKVVTAQASAERERLPHRLSASQELRRRRDAAMANLTCTYAIKA
jgi:hypothetical protein